MTTHAPVIGPLHRHRPTRLIWMALAVVAAAVAVTVIVLMSTSSSAPAQTDSGTVHHPTIGHVARIDCAPTRFVHAC